MTRRIYIYLHRQRLLDSHWSFFMPEKKKKKVNPNINDDVFSFFFLSLYPHFLDHYRSYLTRLGGRDTWMPRQKSPQMDTNGDKDRRGPYSILDPGGGGRLFSLPPLGAT